MRTSLIRFSGEATDAVEQMWREVQQTRTWLIEREQYWRILRAQRERERDDVLAALHRCQEVVTLDDQGRRLRPDCSSHKARLRHVLAQLAEAQQALTNVRHYRRRFEEAAARYQRQKQHIRSFLLQDVAYAGSLLGHAATTVESYLQGGFAAGAADFFSQTATAAAVSVVSAVVDDAGAPPGRSSHRPVPGYFRDATGRRLTLYVLQKGDLHMVRVYNREETQTLPEDPTIADVGMADLALERDGAGQVTRGRLLGLLVLPKYRNSHTGSRILAVVERIAKHYGVQELYGVAPSGKRTYAWFAAHGYGVRADGTEVFKPMVAGEEEAAV